jgi:membrane protein
MAAEEKKNRASIMQVVKQTFTSFGEDKAPRLGAALAYYTIFSLAPLLMIAVGIAGLFYSKHDQAATQIQQQISGLVGEQGGQAIASMVKAASEKPKGGMVSTIIGIVVALFGAAGVFGQLQDSLNTIWEVAPKPGRGIWGFLRDRFLSFAMVGGVCFLLLVSLVLSAVISGANKYMAHITPPWMRIVWTVLSLVVDLGVVSLLFAFIYKFLPDVKMTWRDVWVGAVVTAVLFTIGKWAIGMYLGRASVGSAYGAAGSLVVVLVWIYYSALIFLIGAEFTKVWATERGSKYVPDSNAVALTGEMRAQQGIPRNAALGNASGQPEREDEYAAAGTNGSSNGKTEAPGRLMPATIGFAAGLLLGKMTASAKPRKLVLSPGVRIVQTPQTATRTTARHRNESLVSRFRKGWRTGVKNAS